MKHLYLLVTILFAVNSGLIAQPIAGDYRSSAPGGSSVTVRLNTNGGGGTSAWQRYNGSNWENASSAPSGDASLGDNNVITIQPEDVLSFTTNFNFSSNRSFIIDIRGTISSNSTYSVNYGTGQSIVRITRSNNQNFGNIFQNHNFRNLELIGTGSQVRFTFTGSGLRVAQTLNTTSADVSATAFNLVSNSDLTMNMNGNLTITGSQTITNNQLNVNLFGNNRIVAIGDDPGNDDLTIDGTPGSSLNINFSGSNGLLSIVSEDIDLTNSSITLNGNGATLTQEGDDDPTELDLTNSSINLNGDNQTLSIEGDLDLNNNSTIRMLASNGLFELDNGSSIIDASSTSYIQLSPSSRVSRNIRNGNSFSFPIGTSNYYLPLSIAADNSGSNRTFTVGVFQGATTNAQPDGPASYKPFIVDAIWQILVNGGNTKNANLTFSWPTSLEGTSFSTLSNSGIGYGSFDNASSRWNSSTNGASANNTTNTLTANNVPLRSGEQNSFSISQSFYTLPLTTRNFTAAPRNGDVQMDWIGISTHTTSYFEVERSNKSNGNFTPIAKIPVSTVGEAAYRFTDKNPLEGDNFYRIKIVDENQRVSYTKVLKVQLTGNHMAINNLFPTLAQGSVNLVVSNGNKGNAQIEVFDMTGKIAIRQSITLNTGSQNILLDVSKLSRGSYVLVLKKGDQMEQSRFIKQ